MFCETELSVCRMMGVAAKKPIFELVVEPIFTVFDPIYA